MSLGDYVLQVTPKQIEFKRPTTFIKVSLTLQFGNLQYRSPYSRFIRTNQANFYGQRLKLTNNLNLDASLTIVGINNNKEQAILSKIQISIASYVYKQHPTQNIYEDQEIRFQYEVLLFQKQISEEEFQDHPINKQDNKEQEEEPILLKILSSDLDEKMPETHFDDQKQPSLPSTPRLCQQVEDSPKVVNFKQMNLDQSPIQNKINLQNKQGFTLRSSLKRDSTILSPKSDRSKNSGSSNRSLSSSRNTSKVTFLEPPKEGFRINFSMRNILFYGGLSILSFYTGVCTRLYVDR